MVVNWWFERMGKVGREKVGKWEVGKWGGV
jgi:hypothetical protein